MDMCSVFLGCSSLLAICMTEGSGPQWNFEERNKKQIKFPSSFTEVLVAY